MSYTIELDVEEFTAEDITGLVEAAEAGGGGNLQVKANSPVYWLDTKPSPDPHFFTFTVTILDDGGDVDMEENCTLLDVATAIMMQGRIYDTNGHRGVTVNFGELDIWDASNVFQIAAFGEVIIS